MVVGSNLEYLCGLLNSTIVTKFVRDTAVTTGMGLTQWDKFTVSTIPVPRPPPAHGGRIVSLVKTVLDDSEESARNSATDEVERLVCDLYELDDDERQLMAYYRRGFTVRRTSLLSH